MCLKRIHFNPAQISANLTKLESDFIAKGGKWEEFRIGDLFEVYTGGDMIIGNLKNGDIPLISHKNTDNGVAKYIAKVDNAKIFDYTKTISLADRGCFCASTQNQNFYIGTRVKALVFKESDNVTKNIRLFFVCVINKLQVFFTEYSSNATDELPTLKIKLPTNKNGQIAFDFMESFIKELELERIKELEAYLQATGLNNYELTDKEKQALDIFANSNSMQSLEWQEFRIGDLFEIISLEKLNPLDTRYFRVKQQDELHPIPAIVAKVGDNGIMYYVGKNDFETTKNKLVVIADGAVASGLVYYQGQEFTILHNAYVIQLKYTKFETRHIYMFLQTALQKAIFDFFGYENKPTWNKVKECTFQLPINKNGQIDFDFMESFISAVQKEVIKSVNLWSEKRINATKEVINLH